MTHALPPASTEHLNLVAEILLWLGDDRAADSIYSITEPVCDHTHDVAGWAGVFGG